MDRLPLIILLFILSACRPDENSTKVSEESSNIVDPPLKLMQTASGQISPYEEMIIGGTTFQVGLRDNDTLFIFTRDSTFLTPENYHVGTLFGDLTEELKDNLKEEPGFTYWIDLASGWKLGFCVGIGCTENKPVDSSKVNCIFKRH